jgi:predicted nucleic acid-binding protein
MGLILDSSIVIAAERRGDTPFQLFAQVASTVGDQQLAISSIALTEIVHAIYRTTDSQIRLRREAFIQGLLIDLEVVPYARSTAWIAGKIDGEQRSIGITIPSLDLLIGVTALEIGYSVLTTNIRHFQLIPGLNVLTL